jgi:acyl-coenzyme A thioesterase PaaI-like protein
MQYTITKAQNISKHCLVCGEDNDLSLHARFYETNQNELIGIFSPSESHQSYPGRMHGGISAAILDELIGRAANMADSNAWGVTIELTTKYRKPVPCDKPIIARGRITRDTPRVFEGTGEILLEDGTVAVEAKGRYIKLPLEKIMLGEKTFDDYEMVADHRPVPETMELGICQ